MGLLKMFFNFEIFLNLIYNKKCIICGCSKTDDLLCKKCLKDVEIHSFFPHRIFQGIEIYSCSNYEKNIKKLIHMLKFSHRKNASKPLAKIAFKYFKNINKNNNYTIIFPPSHILRNTQRGFEPMFLIAKEFSKLTGFKIEKNLIKKSKYTKPQYKTKNREKNIKGSFIINKKLIEKYKSKNILLIDDITTSGSTINEILKCLLSCEIKNITCLTISKACL